MKNVIAPTNVDWTRSVDWIRQNVPKSVDAHYSGDDDERARRWWPHKCGVDWQSSTCHWVDCFLDEKREDHYYKDIVKSLDTYGFLVPLIIQERPEDIFRFGNGHHRLAAAIDLGINEIPLFIDTDYMCDVSELSDEQWRAVRRSL